MAKLGKGAERLKSLDTNFQAIARSVIAQIPSSFNGRVVSINIESTLRSKEQNDKAGGAKNSRHLWGGAVDFSISIDDVKIKFPGSYGHYSKSSTVVVGGVNTNAHTLYSIVSAAVTANDCTWGGTFPPGSSKVYDPIHFHWNYTKQEKGLSGKNDEFYIRDENVTLTSEPVLNQNAGSSSNISSSSIAVDATKTTTFIGYGLVLSDFSPLTTGKPLVDLLTGAEVEKKTVEALSGVAGLSGVEAHAKVTSNPNISITAENADAILLAQLNALSDYLVHKKNIPLSEYPSEVSTAVVSYFFGKNMANEIVNKDADSMLAILAISKGNYDRLASFIESRTDGLPSDIKSRRDAEAQLIRSYKFDSNKIAPSIASTNNPEEYANNAKLTELQLANQLTEIDNLINNRKISSTTPASSEYDETFNDVEQATLDSIGNLMQAQQVNTDVYFGYQEDEYSQRVKIKNFYSILSRNLNTRISKIDSLIQTEPLLKGSHSMNMAKMYTMIPYSDNLGYIVKKNAVARCEYRIRLIEKNIRDSESGIMSLGVPSADDWSDILIFISTLWVKMGYNEVVALKNTVTSLFGNLAVLKEQLKLEQGNLVQLKRDVSRYSM